MTRLKLILYMAIIAAGVAPPLVVRQAAQTPLREKNEVLSQQSVELAQLAAENSNLSNAVSARNGTPSLSREQLEELLKLRSEISGLRRQTNEAVKLREENRVLRERLATERNFQPISVPKASFAEVGWATPEAAFQSFIWAMSMGHKNEVLRGLSGDAADSLGKRLMTMPDAEFSANVAGLSEHLAGYQILGKQVVSDNAVILLISLQGGPDRHEEAMTFKKDGNEWKLSFQNAFH